MTRKDYLKRQRENLLKIYETTTDDEHKREILRRIMNIDLETQGKDSFGEVKKGYYTLKRNKIIYVRH